MINISKLYCGLDTTGDALRYGESSHQAPDGMASGKPKSAQERRPVTVWNITRSCNLRCVHCYTDSEARTYSGELTTAEGKTIIADLARFKIPALLFSGGEPLMRKDLFEIAQFAVDKGIRPTLSTNGTLLTAELARTIKEVGFTYVGISLDGMEAVNDRFRGKTGAFRKAMEGFDNCTSIGQRVGLRLTLTRYTVKDLHRIFDFIEERGINRACFYHLAYSGRGQKIMTEDLTHEESRRALDIILERTEDFTRRGLNKDILTVDNHVDGVYIYLKLRDHGSERAEEVHRLLAWNGGGTYSSGVGIGCIDFEGNVHPDQFWMHYSFGNVRERPFSEIWMDTSDPLMAGLKNRRPLLKGRCGACKWQELCGGALRVRADKASGDPWAQDPACYLTDEEIGLRKS